MTAMQHLRHTRRRGGQALVEFALVISAFLLVLGGVIQFGLILWSVNSVTQVARDTARWAAAESTTPCVNGRAAVVTTAGNMAQRVGLLGYRPGMWTYVGSIAGMPTDEGVGSDWVGPPPPPTLFDSDCPAESNQVAWTVRVRVNHVVPIFFPGLQFVAPACPTAGFCLTASAQLRMEPKAP